MAEFYIYRIDGNDLQWIGNAHGSDAWQAINTFTSKWDHSLDSNEYFLVEKNNLVGPFRQTMHYDAPSNNPSDPPMLLNVPSDSPSQRTPLTLSPEQAEAYEKIFAKKDAAYPERREEEVIDEVEQVYYKRAQLPPDPVRPMNPGYRELSDDVGVLGDV